MAAVLGGRGVQSWLPDFIFFNMVKALEEGEKRLFFLLLLMYDSSGAIPYLEERDTLFFSSVGTKCQ